MFALIVFVVFGLFFLGVLFVFFGVLFAAEGDAAHERTLLEREPHARRTEDVAGIAERELDAGQHFDRMPVADGADLLQHVERVLERVEGLGEAPGAWRTSLAVLPLGIALLHRGGVRQQDAQEVATRGIGVDGTAEAALAQQRQSTAVVDVGMAEDDRVDLCGIEGKRGAVALVRRGATLDHAAVEQQPPAVHDEDVTAAGHFTGPAVELELHADRLRRSAGRRSPRFRVVTRVRAAA